MSNFSDKLLSVSPRTISFEFDEGSNSYTKHNVVIANNGWNDLFVKNVAIIGNFNIVGQTPGILKPGEKYTVELAVGDNLQAGVIGYLIVDAGEKGLARVDLEQVTTSDIEAAAQVVQDVGNAAFYNLLIDLPSADGEQGWVIIPGGPDEGIYQDTGSWEKRFETQAVRAEIEADRAETERQEAEAAKAGSLLARNQAADLVLPENIFIASSIEAARLIAEGATVDGTYFKAVDTSTGIIEVRLRTAASSDFLYTELTQEGLGLPGGAQNIGVSSNETALSIFNQSIRITDGRFAGGAKFDVSEVDDILNATDDTDAWEAAFSYLQSVGGGTRHLPHGGSKVTRMLNIPVDVPIRIVGDGCRKVYPGDAIVGKNVPSTVVPYHTGRCTFRFFGASAGQGSFIGLYFNIAAMPGHPMPDCAFGWETQGGFLYGFTFRNMGIHSFRKSTGVGAAFEVYKNAGTEAAVGAVLIEDCVINHNNWIARNLNSTHFNGFRFKHNKAGQNGYTPGNGGIQIRSHDVSIQDNVIEATRDAVVCSGGFSDVVVSGNYFEANVGAACIRIDNARSYKIGPNDYGHGFPMAADGDDTNVVAKLATLVYLYAVEMGECVDPYIGNGVNKSALPKVGRIEANRNNTSAGTLKVLRADAFDGKTYHRTPNWLTSNQQGTTVNLREIDPQTGKPTPATLFTSSGSGAFTSAVGLPTVANKWVAFSWLITRTSEAGAGLDPLTTLVPDGDYGRRVDLPFYNFRQCWRSGEWSLITGAFKLPANMSTITYLMYPYGYNPPANLTANVFRPLFYSVDDVNDVIPYFNSAFSGAVSSPPSSGTWFAGDRLQGMAGVEYICTASGSPGTWVTKSP